MDKLTKVFRDGEVLYAQDLNTVSEKVNEIVDEINEGGGDLPAGAVTTDKIADKAVTMDKLSQDVQEAIGSGGGGGDAELSLETFSGTLLMAQAGKYYRATEAVETLSVILPALDNPTTTKSLMIHFTAGLVPNVNISAADGVPVSFYIGYTIDAGAEYELNIMFNGGKWIVAYGVIANA